MRQIIVFALFLAAGSASAVSSDVKNYDYLKDKEWFQHYIYGVAEGFFMANAALAESKRKPLFCVEPTFSMSRQQVTQFLDQAVKIYGPDPKLHDIPLEAMLLDAFQTAKPCK